MKKENGFSILMLLVVVAAVVIAAVWFSFYSESAPPLDASKLRDITKKTDTGEDMEDTDFEVIEEDEFTPVEVDNEALEELDSIMNSIVEEDLSDLDDL